MSQLASDIFQHLVEDQGLRAYVGNRIYPQLSPSDASLPYIVYTLASEDEEISLNTFDAGITKSEWQYDCWGLSQEQVDTIAALVKARLTISNMLIGSTVVQAAFSLVRTDQLVSPNDGTELPIPGARVSVTIWAEE